MSQSKQILTITQADKSSEEERKINTNTGDVLGTLRKVMNKNENGVERLQRTKRTKGKCMRGVGNRAASLFTVYKN